jgi:hypothetical protein
LHCDNFIWNYKDYFADIGRSEKNKHQNPNKKWAPMSRVSPTRNKKLTPRAQQQKQIPHMSTRGCRRSNKKTAEAKKKKTHEQEASEASQAQLTQPKLRDPTRNKTSSMQPLKQKNCGSPTGNPENPTATKNGASFTGKKKNPRVYHNKTLTPQTKNCATPPMAKNGKLVIFARAKRRIKNARTQRQTTVRPPGAPLPQLKQKTAQATPMAN